MPTCAKSSHCVPFNFLRFGQRIQEQHEQDRRGPEEENKVARPWLIDRFMKNGIVNSGHPLGDDPQGKSTRLKIPEGTREALGPLARRSRAVDDGYDGQSQLKQSANQRDRAVRDVSSSRTFSRNSDSAKAGNNHQVRRKGFARTTYFLHIYSFETDTLSSFRSAGRQTMHY